MAEYKNLRTVVVINRDTKNVTTLNSKTRVEVINSRIENNDKYAGKIFVCAVPVGDGSHWIFEMFENKFRELFIGV